MGTDSAIQNGALWRPTANPMGDGLTIESGLKTMTAGKLGSLPHAGNFFPFTHFTSQTLSPATKASLLSF